MAAYMEWKMLLNAPMTSCLHVPGEEGIHNPFHEIHA